MSEQIPEFDPKRFESLVLHIAYRTKSDERFGRTKLAKALFYSDFTAYREVGEALTGAVYVKEDHGPFPVALPATEWRLADRGLVTLKQPLSGARRSGSFPLVLRPCSAASSSPGNRSG